jgi:hypothetical protein
MKQPNREGSPLAEAVEGRTLPNGNVDDDDRGADTAPGSRHEWAAPCAERWNRARVCAASPCLAPNDRHL